MEPLELWYDRPATTWTEAMPIGNGRLGAMVFGDISRERLQINESTFFSGGPYTPNNPEASKYLANVRELIFAGRFREAEALAHERLMGKPYLQMSFQPVGDIWITFHHNMNASSYRRSLNIDTAIAATAYQAGTLHIRREAFVSPVAGVLVYRITTDQPGSLFLDVALSSPQIGDIRDARYGESLLYVGQNRKEQGVAGALRFALGVKVLHQDGELSMTPDTIRVRAATSVTLMVDAATSYRRYDDVSGDPVRLIEERFVAAAGKDFATHRDEHIGEHRRLFRSMTIDLGTTPAADRPTDQRIATPMAEDGQALTALFTQYGRYLAISSSRPGTHPANLQGLWNDEVRPPWGSKYTANINLEMNYWLPDPANLAECFEPLVEMVEDLAETGRRTAEVHYGASGWVLHHNTDLWRATAPVDGPMWGLWPMGGVWLCAQLWDHYLFSMDQKLLRRIYPLMKGAAQFIVDFLVEHPQTGHLVTVPSLSPENAHPFGTSLCAGPAMDNQLIRDLFNGLIEASKTLDVDSAFRDTLAGIVVRLAPDKIGSGGQLQEWFEDWDLTAPEPHHRHVSHLYGVYPSWQIDRVQTPELADAARRSLELRGNEATGWGIGWRLNLWARLGDAERAHEVITRLLRSDRTYPNLFDAHPPFQIDGNFGGAAGVIEMLVQSRPGRLQLLPALPAAWAEGRLSGARCRGAIDVSLVWSDGQLEQATLTSAIAQSVEVIYGNSAMLVRIAPGQPVRLDYDPSGLRAA